MSVITELRVAIAFPIAMLAEALAKLVIWVSDGELSVNFDYMNKKSKDHWNNLRVKGR